MKWIIQIFMAKSATPNTSFFRFICPKIGHEANPGVVYLIVSRKNLTVSPDGGTVHFTFVLTF